MMCLLSKDSVSSSVISSSVKDDFLLAGFEVSKSCMSSPLSQVLLLLKLNLRHHQGWD